VRKRRDAPIGFGVPAYRDYLEAVFRASEAIPLVIFDPISLLPVADGKLFPVSVRLQKRLRVGTSWDDGASVQALGLPRFCQSKSSPIDRSSGPLHLLSIKKFCVYPGIVRFIESSSTSSASTIDQLNAIHTLEILGPGQKHKMKIEL
jgi:hypothetical protein